MVNKNLHIGKHIVIAQMNGLVNCLWAIFLTKGGENGRDKEMSKLWSRESHFESHLSNMPY
jgi:hypothetical protein